MGGLLNLQSMEKNLPEVQLQDFQYDLPDERIAQRPLGQRDHSRLLQYRDGTISHHQFGEITSLLPAGTMLLLNDTKVIKARLYFRRATGALIEVLLMHPQQPAEVQATMQAQGEVVWQCIVGNKKKWKPEESLVRTLETDSGDVTITAKWIDREKNHIQFRWEEDIVFAEWLQAAGDLPLPPYIHRDADDHDLETYQTVYAEHTGAVAAPTAGLHFTEAVFDRLKANQVTLLQATLHVSAGTFLPVKTDNPLEHDMHQEQMVIRKETVQAVLAQLKSGHPIVPVGTTSMRWIESLYWIGVKLANGETQSPSAPFLVHKLDGYHLATAACSAEKSMQAILAWFEQHQVHTMLGETSILIMPGYDFRVCDGLITNFHMPGTTLMLLVGAFVGEDWRTIYAAALAKEYRFLSYGDSSLLWRRK